MKKKKLDPERIITSHGCCVHSIFTFVDIEWTQNPHFLFVDIELMTCSHHLKQAELYYISVIMYYLKTFVLEKIKLCELKKR